MRSGFACDRFAGVLAVCLLAGSANAQQFRPVPPPMVRPVQVPPPPVSVQPPKYQTVTPVYAPPTYVPPSDATGMKGFWWMFLVPTIMFVVSGIFFGHAILSAIGRLFHRLRAPTDPVAAAYDDPWIRQEIARRQAAEASGNPDPPTFQPTATRGEPPTINPRG